MSQLILAVDQLDQSLGLVDKYEAHRRGILHRAFSIFIFRFVDSSLQVLLHQRAKDKYHSSGLWTNTCCSHAIEEDSLEETARRRLEEEMGFSCDLHRLGSFYYKADVGHGLVEHEIDHVFVGLDNPELIRPNPQEVQDWRWISTDLLLKLPSEEKKLFTVWFFQAFELALGYFKTKVVVG
jgi:isopentenyl-diphosphate delta-isomerase